MTAEHEEQIERTLSELTKWHGRVPPLWRRALAAARPADAPRWPRLAWVLRHRVSAAAAASIAIVALGITIAANLPHLGVRARVPHWGSARTSRGVSPAETDGSSAAFQLHTDLGKEIAETLRTPGQGDVERTAETGLERYTLRRGFVAGSGAWGGGARSAPAGGFQDENADAAGAALLGAQLTPAEADGQPGDRHVVRKATIELATDDVRAVFARVGQIINEADGEYVQESSLTGSAENMKAELTLRVAAHRLSGVLNKLRELGEVRSELLGGQDVTAQVVDVEARLRNEQRVEAELLELLQKRQDAPLTEILQLRATLSDVRGVIERLTAQRQKLSQLVDLATVPVIIRTQQAPPDQAGDFSITSYFGAGVQRAWQKGLMLLADTCGFLLSVLVGGLIWWVLLAAVIVAIWRYRRRAGASTTKS